MSRPASFAIAALLLIGAGHAPAATAKEYNQAPTVPSDTQAMINRIRADIAVAGDDQGAFGTFEDDCGELNVGANSAGSAPDEQVIIADTIVNVGGNCRIVRSSGGFNRDPAGTPPETLSSSTKPTYE